jgi:hypothetical protein
LIPNIKPDVTAVPPVLTGLALLQRAEMVQLTGQNIAPLFADDGTAEVAKFFSFKSKTSERASTPACKTFSGDSAWSKESFWDTIDSLLDGALRPNVPIAASCYNTQ